MKPKGDRSDRQEQKQYRWKSNSPGFHLWSCSLLAGGLEAMFLISLTFHLPICGVGLTEAYLTLEMKTHSVSHPLPLPIHH